MTRIAARFEQLKKQSRAGLVTFTMAGDPDIETSFQILQGLPEAGADFIELGMAFTDPMADGPAIQLAGQRALKAGITLTKTLDLVRRFRETDDDTPIILMGYYNPIYRYGRDRFLEDAQDAGVDGLIIVDLPPEEDGELCIPSHNAGIDFIRLLTPTTDDDRLPVVLNRASGFLYYVAIAGVTGTASAVEADIATALERIRKHTDLPCVVGFGVKTPENVAEFARHADAVVVGSAIVSKIGEGAAQDGDFEKTVTNALDFVKELAGGLTMESAETEQAASI